ncbi:FUSC family protein [Sodalis-like symbiont of Bactericera trigonica]|nr:FUSC family protein [Sodalis-like symbiont of Bactericera trigonica]
MSLPAWPIFSSGEILYLLKSYTAAMLALYLSSRAGLPNMFWSLMTVYVVSQPLAGIVRSKALFRITSTFIGSDATVLFIPALSNAPVLLTLAMGVWVSVCLLVSLLDRTPRAYAFMLAGFPAALIGFPAVQNPAAIFDTAVSRVEEICLGILCATLVHSVVLTAGLSASVMGLMDKTLRDTRRWLTDIFADAAPPTPGSVCRWILPSCACWQRIFPSKPATYAGPRPRYVLCKRRCCRRCLRCTIA